MNDEPRVPFGQTTGGIVLIQGVMTAVVSAIVTSAINNSADLPWLTIAGLFLAIGLIVFLLTSLLRRRLRSAMWGWLPSLIQWLGGLRITTARQRDAALRVAHEDGASLIADKTKPLLSSTLAERNRLKEKLEQALSDGAKSELGRQTAEYLAADWERKFHAAQLAMLDFGEQGKRRPDLPPPDPRWDLKIVHDDAPAWTYEIRNLMPNSVAYNVRMDADNNGFDFADAAFWEDLSGVSSGRFSGEPSGWGAVAGFKLVLEWLNQDGEPCTKSWTIKEEVPF